jgi:hypothetical protein
MTSDLCSRSFGAYPSASAGRHRCLRRRKLASRGFVSLISRALQPCMRFLLRGAVPLRVQLEPETVLRDGVAESGCGPQPAIGTPSILGRGVMQRETVRRLAIAFPARRRSSASTLGASRKMSESDTGSANSTTGSSGGGSTGSRCAQAASRPANAMALARRALTPPPDSAPHRNPAPGALRCCRSGSTGTRGRCARPLPGCRLRSG